MTVVYIKEKNIYMLVRSLLELDFSNLSISRHEFWEMSEEELEKHFIMIDAHKSNMGRLAYNEDEGQWEWHVFDKPRVLKKYTFNDIPVYSDAEVIERIPLIVSKEFS